jgi:hypothetical protein
VAPRNHKVLGILHQDNAPKKSYLLGHYGDQENSSRRAGFLGRLLGYYGTGRLLVVVIQVVLLPRFLLQVVMVLVKRGIEQA